MEHSEVKSDLVALRGYIITGQETKTFRWSALEKIYLMHRENYVICPSQQQIHFNKQI